MGCCADCFRNPACDNRFRMVAVQPAILWRMVYRIPFILYPRTSIGLLAVLLVRISASLGETQAFETRRRIDFI